MAEDGVTGRLIALTDGVLSIAMTLLVLDIRLPPVADRLDDGQLWQALLGIGPQLESYGLSLLVVALFWLNHVGKIRRLKQINGLLI